MTSELENKIDKYIAQSMSYDPKIKQHVINAMEAGAKAVLDYARSIKYGCSESGIDLLEFEKLEEFVKSEDNRKLIERFID
ncbi:hypothetical protein EKK58_12125 [Candidatus Dependentiae bacterium]|nr:MAG: hypothetical protein EKK58_12125 [Candidatus Dependentiae bacterium]